MSGEKKKKQDGSEESIENEDIDSLKEALRIEQDKTQQYIANWQRAEADFSNYKKRSEKERLDLIHSANAALIKEILPIVDDFDRAFESLPDDTNNNEWIDGIQLIHSKMKNLLESQGVNHIEAVGSDFDPSIHEAVAYHDGEEGKVISEVLKGYTMGNKILRPTLAVVGKGLNESDIEDVE